MRATHGDPQTPAQHIRQVNMKETAFRSDTHERKNKRQRAIFEMRRRENNERQGENEKRNENKTKNKKHNEFEMCQQQQQQQHSFRPYQIASNEDPIFIHTHGISVTFFSFLVNFRSLTTALAFQMDRKMTRFFLTFWEKRAYTPNSRSECARCNRNSILRI